MFALFSDSLRNVKVGIRRKTENSLRDERRFREKVMNEIGKKRNAVLNDDNVCEREGEGETEKESGRAV